MAKGIPRKCKTKLMRRDKEIYFMLSKGTIKRLTILNTYVKHQCTQFRVRNYYTQRNGLPPAEQ